MERVITSYLFRPQRSNAASWKYTSQFFHFPFFRKDCCVSSPRLSNNSFCLLISRLMTLLFHFEQIEANRRELSPAPPATSPYLPGSVPSCPAVPCYLRWCLKPVPSDAPESHPSHLLYAVTPTAIAFPFYGIYFVFLLDRSYQYINIYLLKGNKQSSLTLLPLMSLQEVFRVYIHRLHLFFSHSLLQPLWLWLCPDLLLHENCFVKATSDPTLLNSLVSFQSSFLAHQQRLTQLFILLRVPSLFDSQVTSPPGVCLVPTPCASPLLASPLSPNLLMLGCPRFQSWILFCLSAHSFAHGSQSYELKYHSSSQFAPNSQICSSSPDLSPQTPHIFNHLLDISVLISNRHLTCDVTELSGFPILSSLLISVFPIPTCWQGHASSCSGPKCWNHILSLFHTHTHILTTKSSLLGPKSAPCSPPSWEPPSALSWMTPGAPSPASCLLSPCSGTVSCQHRVPVSL